MSDPSGGLLRVATYNIHRCRGLDGRTRPERIAEVLEGIDADVIALQEVVGEHAEYLAGELGLFYTHGENRKHGGAAYGNAILSRFDPQSVQNYNVTVAGREERGCLRTDLDVPNAGPVHVFNVHLGTSYLERRAQAHLLMHDELLGSVSLRGPRIVLGDFNEWTQGLASRMLGAEFGRARIKGRSYPGILPFLHLDNVYYDRRLRLEESCLHRTPTSLVASDHLPLLAVFGIGE